MSFLWGGTVREKKMVQEAGYKRDKMFSRNKNLGKMIMEFSPNDTQNKLDWCFQRS